MKKTTSKIIAVTALPILFAAVLVLYMTGILGSEKRKIDDIENYALSFDDFTIPTDARAIGIGEATHGNHEFQVAKLEVLQKLVETGNCKSLSLEISVGEGAYINDAIHNKDDVDFEELVGELDYPLYDTPDMANLFKWMKEYNEGRSYEDSVAFYGVDMQGSHWGVKYLLPFCKEFPNEFGDDVITKLTALDDDPDTDTLNDEQFFKDLKEKLLSVKDPRHEIAALVAESVLEDIASPSFSEDANSYGEYRDSSMAKNFKTISEIEERRGYSQVLISAHNGHVMRGPAESYGEISMGSHIDKLFDGKYFIIGTEFYNSCDNIHTAGTYDEEYERKNHNFCSSDRLAFQAKDFEDERYVLVFDDVTDTKSDVYDIIHHMNFTGVMGEGYTFYVDIYKSYRTKLIVADRYDAMIYYYDVTPIETIHY